jgi:hypothetical protein
VLRGERRARGRSAEPDRPLLQRRERAQRLGLRTKLRRGEHLLRDAEADAAETAAHPVLIGEVTAQRVRELHAKIGELTMERDFLSSALGRFPSPSAKR